MPGSLRSFLTCVTGRSALAETSRRARNPTGAIRPRRPVLDWSSRVSASRDLAHGDRARRTSWPLAEDPVRPAELHELHSLIFPIERIASAWAFRFGLHSATSPACPPSFRSSACSAAKNMDVCAMRAGITEAFGSRGLNGPGLSLALRCGLPVACR